MRQQARSPAHQTSFRPYLTASAGSYIGTESKTEVGFWVEAESRSATTFGAHLGGGLDIQLNRSLMLGTHLGYHLMADFSKDLGGKDNYSALEAGVGISFLFGRGSD